MSTTATQQMCETKQTRASVDGRLGESVLVVPTALVSRLCPSTFSSNAQAVKAPILAGCRFLARSSAEHDFRYKQIIPYVVIRNGERYLLIRRTRRQTESRLHDMYSLGIGGHINNDDSSDQDSDLIESGMRWELAEEIGLEAEASCIPIGVINDNSTEVARVHLGFVYLLTANSDAYTIVEEDNYTAHWSLPADTSRYYDQMESWAQIVHDYVVFPDAVDRQRKWEVQA